MSKIEFENPNDFPITLVGPNGRQLSIGRRGRITLDDWWMRYCPKHLHMIREIDDGIKATPVPKHIGQQQQQQQQQHLPTANKVALRRTKVARVGAASSVKTERQTKTPPSLHDRRVHLDKRRMVGKSTFVNGQSTRHYVEIVAKLDQLAPSFSDNIGVGILSYNRLNCVKRLLCSIRAHTDLSRVTVFISDESSDQSVKSWLRDQHDVVLVDNDVRLGVAGNSNRLLKCLSRFKYKLLLNDDVEVLSDGWERFYFDAMTKTGMHHFCYRQSGVYGANPSDIKRVKAGDVILNRVDQKPHGAVMAFDQLCFEKVGYFDEGFNPYGMEHVDWSNRVHYAGLQSSGYYDVNGSERHFRIHHVHSATEDRSATLMKSNERFRKVSQDRSRIFVDSGVTVPSMSVVVPFRGADRLPVIRVVVDNLRCQLFPQLEIIVVEQDCINRLDPADVYPAKVLLCPSEQGRQFCKSAAFNMGVINASYNHVVLHDADMIVQINYCKLIYEKLQKHEACHMGKDVAYFDVVATDHICKTRTLPKNPSCERTVSYFEGGSLAVHKDTYERIGGFNEDFVGYGCFGPGNFVLTKNGYKKIETINKNDLVFTHKKNFEQIITSVRRYRGKVFDIFVPGGSIKCVTPEHPFLISAKDSVYIWKKASELKANDIIIGKDDSASHYFIPNKIYKIVDRDYDGPVYNMEVQGDHSYIVNGLIVHNCEDCEFFRRLKSQSKFDDERTTTLFHLWHGRTAGWGECHQINKRKWHAFESKPINDRTSQLKSQLQKWKGKSVTPLKHVPITTIPQMQEIRIGGALCCGPDGGAFKYYVEGIGNAFRELGIDFRQWDGKDESIIRELKPRIYIACSEAWKHIYPEWAKKEYDTKLIIHANPYGRSKVGSVDGGPVIDAKEQDIKWVVSQNPDRIICYAANDDVVNDYFNFWSDRHGIAVQAMPLAADHVTYGLGTDVEKFRFDVGWIGGMWNYKQKMMDKYLIPLRSKYRCGFYGWNNAWGMGLISNEDSKHLFRSCKICPSVSEPHSVMHPLDVPERIYKVPCAGGFTIHTPTTAVKAMGLAEVIPVASNVDDWFEKIHYFMMHDDERVKLATEQRKAILCGHTYLHRITKLIKDYYPEMIEILEEKKKSLINS